MYDTLSCESNGIPPRSPSSDRKLIAPTGLASRFDRDPARKVRRNRPPPPLARPERHLKLGSVSIGEFKRSASREADRFVYRLNRAKPPPAALWRGLSALAFVERAKAADPNGGETGGTPP